MGRRRSLKKPTTRRSLRPRPRPSLVPVEPVAAGDGGPAPAQSNLERDSEQASGFQKGAQSASSRVAADSGLSAASLRKVRSHDRSSDGGVADGKLGAGGDIAGALIERSGCATVDAPHDGLAPSGEQESDPMVHSEFDDAFFAAQPRALHSTSPAPNHDSLDSRPSQPPAHRSSRRAMVVSLAMFAVSFVSIGGYLAYHKLWLPTPVPVGDTAPLSLDNFRPESPDSPESPVELAAAPTALAVTDPALAAAPPVNELRSAGGQPSGGALASPATHAGAQRVVAAAGDLANHSPSPGEVGLESGSATEPQRDSSALAETGTSARRLGAVGAGSEHRGPSAQSAAPLFGEKQAHPAAVAVLMQRAADHADKGEMKDAEAAYQAVLALRPDVSIALSRLALIKLGTNHNREAGRLATRAVAADATNAEAWIVLGAVRQAKRDRSGARDAYQACAKLNDAQYSTECRRMLR